jgi:hypothetical protein
MTLRWRDLAPAAVVLAVGIGFLFWSQSFSARARLVPTLASWLTIVLALIDAAAQLDTGWGRRIRRLVTARNVVEWRMEGEPEAETRRAAVAIGWVFGYLALLALVGFLAATPIYMFLYMLIHGRRSLRDASLAAIVTTFAIWLCFEVAFRYPLYPGLLFGGER